MATEQLLALVEDVLQQHGARSRDIDMASRKAEEASLRRYEAAGWLRKTVGVVGGKDLPAEPSEEEFRLGLRSGIILCNVLNKVNPGAIPKVVEGPCDSVIIPDGAALSAYQYFENVRNFLVAVEEMGLPTFEASDLEQGGKSARIVNCVLALKSYSDWKQSGCIGSWKFAGNSKPPTSNGSRQFVRKNSEPFMNSISRTMSLGEKSIDSLSSDQSSHDDVGHDHNDAGAPRSLDMLVRAVLANKKQEEIPILLESMLSQIMEEFERRLASQNEVKTTPKDTAASSPILSLSRTSSSDIKMEEEVSAPIRREECLNQKHDDCNAEASKQLQKMHVLLEQQQKDVQVLKSTFHTTKEGMQFLQMRYQEEFNNLGKHLHGLAHAASGYQKVLEENRKLYNQVQDLKGNIRVYCRVRPFLTGKANCLSTVEHIVEGNITITTSTKYGKDGRKSFTFNKVFGPSATQEEVFSDTQPLVRSVLDGYNVCIFAYGQTGSGKTFTMTGPKELTEESLGVNYRALSDLFLLSHQRRDIISYDISVQMLEIYNEQVRDLLVTDGLNKRLEIRNSSQTGINVPDANLVPVSTTSDVINLMNLGQQNRAVSATAMNDRSSRSHSCLTVHVQGKDLTSGTVLRGCMHLVDLAGSERVDKSEVTGDRLKEAQHINKSLSALGDVISSLAQKNSHVPYRNSKLTQLLQDSLGGQAKTLMFVHISPEADAVGETISTLKFAERVASVELGAARVNKDSAEVKELKEQIANLKTALERKEGESEHLPHSQFSSPESSITKPRGFSSHHSWHGAGDKSSNRRHPMDDAGSVEGKKKSSLKPRRRSLDPQDMMNSPPWPPLGSPALSGKDDDKESASSGDWVDKVMVNKLDSLSRVENLDGHWEGLDNRQLPETFYQSVMLDSSKIYPEQPYNRYMMTKKDNQDYDAQQNRYETASTDDELEAATRDCSEPDYLWQSNLPRPSSLANGSGPKTKKSNLRAPKVIETRSSIPSLIPQPSRKLPNGVSQPSLNTENKQVPLGGKRRVGHAK
ncbi:kinesin-like protein KIN-14I isoform X2 [Tripterygium wilfordii]|uniref:kinesin-like protein KIN-14I isoform X2 n=1 Tax=Tripterygium wilfordii TaxID=458696 RepID=UPI0018F7E825|nr:kinesin-like protein KIN-14I isoform X2 [Tripterygium wilfordii]